jgi:hypothetical protein
MALQTIWVMLGSPKSRWHKFELYISPQQQKLIIFHYALLKGRVATYITITPIILTMDSLA